MSAFYFIQCDLITRVPYNFIAAGLVSAAGPAQSCLSTGWTEGDVSGARVSPTEGVEVVLLQLEEGGGHQDVAGGTGGVLHPLAPPHPTPELDPAPRAPG